MKTLDETANRSAAKGFAKILAVIIILSVAAFGDIMYIVEMQRVFTNDPSLLLFCYLGAFTSFMAIGYLLLGKSVVFMPGAQMLAAWIVFTAELLIIALNIMLVFTKHPTGFMGAWAFISPATPVFHMLGVAMIYFLDPEMKEKHRDMELKSKMRQLDREHQFALAEARMAVKAKQVEYTVRELGTAVNSSETQSRISQHASKWNDDILTEMSGRTLPKDEKDDPYNDRYYGRR
ncbi:MAG: hypothetical protein ACJ788_19730 [Ktedonobacteraceae bacterium]